MSKNIPPHRGYCCIIGAVMKKEFLECGKIVGTHGVKGMVRIQPWSDDGEFLTDFKRFFIDGGNTEIKPLSVKPHGRVVLALFDGVTSIEQAEKLRGKTLLIKREDANLADGRYFIDELIGCKVFDAENNALLGILTDVSSTGANDVWHITKDGIEYLVPAIPDVIVNVDIIAEKVIIKPLKGIFDDAN